MFVSLTQAVLSAQRDWAFSTLRHCISRWVYSWVGIAGTRSFYTFMLSPFLPHILNTYITHSYCFTDDFTHICMCCSGTGPGACDGSGPIRMSTTRWPQEEVFNEDVCSPALWSHLAKQEHTSTIWCLLPLSFCSLFPGNALWSPWSLTPIPSFCCVVGNFFFFLLYHLICIYFFQLSAISVTRKSREQWRTHKPWLSLIGEP